MIPVPSGVRVWLATEATDMRRGVNGLTLQVQEASGRDTHAGDLYVFRGRRDNLIKVLWQDGLGCSLYAKRLERGRFVWPSLADGVVAISSAQLGYLLEGTDWRNPVSSWRPPGVLRKCPPCELESPPTSANAGVLIEGQFIGLADPDIHVAVSLVFRDHASIGDRQRDAYSLGSGAGGTWPRRLRKDQLPGR